MICHSDRRLALYRQPFNPSLCRTHLGNPIGGSQVTGLCEGDADGDHSSGAYTVGFRATLIRPWMATLVKPRLMSTNEREMHSLWRKDGDWSHFVHHFRG
jgi:hypothetical protein